MVDKYKKGFTESSTDSQPADAHRRNFLHTAVKTSAAGALLASPVAAICANAQPKEQATSPLPKRGEYIFRNGYILSMDPAIGEFATGDVHVKDGVILSVGRSISSQTAEIIDATDCIVMPGFIDGHWHMMNSLWRGLVNDKPGYTYFEIYGRLGPAYTPQDSVAGVRLALAEAINGGITTVHNWANNVRSPAHADAELAAHVASGVRFRWSYGAPFGLPSIPWDDVVRVQKQWFAAGDRMMTYGIASTAAGVGPQTITGVAAEMVKARKLGLPISIHELATGPDSPDSVRFLIDAKLLGPDVQLLHGNGIEPYFGQIVEAGTTVALSPTIDPMTLPLVPPVPGAMSAGIKLSFSVDTSGQAAADMFTNMRVEWAASHMRANGSNLPTARELLQIATLGGAVAHGLQDVTGSLTPGKRGDLIMVRKSDINMQIAPDIDPAWLLVSSGRPENIDTVLVDGRILKRKGTLTTVNVPELMRTASTALQGLRARTKLPPLGMAKT
ncbi:amidohydrolase family protein [Herbaspirillum rubrisubalbicans]|uniref:Cytosine deaminase n=1 Tax=Herbaspirillum rubrisubalbicans TaxID=80842 RepID=A0AAD0U8E4_9BURK|nr:amidohydrolase family protein [Herbaspirillum rubrisubalbicans]ALU89537.1 hydroxy-atrazine ethyl amino hydrolase [Herbaspirillum rubrisubalbicans M1]AYR24618.1 cytosine deaminase [Herbaspirillum rubrisubalbicans]